MSEVLGLAASRVGKQLYTSIHVSCRRPVGVRCLLLAMLAQHLPAGFGEM